MLTKDGAVKVLDFGLAKFDEEPRSADVTQSPTMMMSATREGVILGTAAYMSPEQARGQTIDKRTDIWAFGCVLYEMLTGRAVFARDTLSDTIAAILEHAPDWSALPGDTPAGIRRLLLRCLEKNPARRTRDIGDVQLELEDIEKGALPTAPGQRLPTSTRLAWPLAIVSVAALGLGVAATRPMWTAVDRAPAFSRVTQLGHGAAVEHGPAISPDGKWIAYLSNARGPTDVWVRYLSGGDPINLTASTTLGIQSRGDLGGLAISPDGSIDRLRRGRDQGDAGPAATMPGSFRRRLAVRRARSSSSVARCAGHQTERRSPLSGPDRPPETRCMSLDPMAAARAKSSRCAARCTFTGQCGRMTGATSTSSTPSRRQTANRAQSTASPPQVDRWSRW